MDFSYRGYVVVAARTGDEAISILKNINFDIILSDFQMPNGNGMSVLNYVNTMNPKAIFFFISGQSTISVDECLKAGAAKYFNKPFDLDNLAFEINEVMKKSA
jgi:DNA-binding NtrC family response regulator